MVGDRVEIIDAEYRGFYGLVVGIETGNFKVQLEGGPDKVFKLEQLKFLGHSE